MKTQTIKQWLETLEEPYRTQALVNYSPNFHYCSRMENVTDALVYAFHWEKSPQGHDYWSELYKRL